MAAGEGLGRIQCINAVNTHVLLARVIAHGPAVVVVVLNIPCNASLSCNVLQHVMHVSAHLRCLAWVVPLPLYSLVQHSVAPEDGMHSNNCRVVDATRMNTF